MRTTAKWAIGVLLLVGVQALQAQSSSASQSAALAATMPNMANGGQAATAAAPMPAAAPAEAGGWVEASTPQAASAPAQVPSPAANNLGGFPSAPVVIAPPPAGFAATSKGPGDYGAADGGAGQPQPNSAPNGSVPPPPMINQARDMVSPLAPTEIRELHQDFDATRRAKAEDLVTAVPRISSISVDLSPGGAPPVVHTMINQQTSIVFLDSTGAPWPLAATPRLASAGYFDVRWLKDTANVVVTATSSYETIGMAVYLSGLATPVVLQLNSGEVDSNKKTRVVDARLDLRIPGRGPNAKAAVMGQSRISMYDDTLQSFLDGVPPSGAHRVAIDGVKPSQTEVWSFGDSLYLRTPLEIRSAFEQTTSSADGMHIYKLDPTPLIMVSNGGENLSLTLEIE